MAIRRFLQPSPTLRWHPWAPLVLLILAFAFVFAFGVRWGYSVGKREITMNANTYASTVKMEYFLERNRPAMHVMRKAGAIDAAVRRYLRDQQEEPTLWERTRRWVERAVFYRGRPRYQYPREAIVNLAEFRLSEMSGSAPLWQPTASYCEETHSPISGLDFRAEYEEVAREYAQLLGRPIGAAQLAPLVPNMRCEPRSVQ